MTQGVAQPDTGLDAAELLDAWPLLDAEERVEGFRLLAADEGERFLASLGVHDECELLLSLRPSERQLWMRQLPPDDAADVVQAAPEEHREEFQRRLYELVNEFKERGPDPDGDTYSFFSTLHPDLNPPSSR